MRRVLDGPVGWVLLSREAVARAEEALGPNDRGVRDEVGFLALHQGFSDRFFPGTSVLHTRLKYLLFVPWLMEMVAERGGTDYASRFAAAETELAGQLLRQENPDGVIGGRIWPRPVAQPPSMAYWTALRTWHILRARPDGSAPSRVEALRLMATRARRRSRATDDEGVTLERDFGHAFVKLPDKPRELGAADKPLDFSLNDEERRFLRRHLLGVKRYGSKELSLLARLADAGIGSWDTGLWAPEIGEVADSEDRDALTIARQASALAGIGRAVYAALLEIAYARDGFSESFVHRERLAELIEIEGRQGSAVDLVALERLLPGLPKRLRRVLSATRDWLASGNTNPEPLYDEYMAAERGRKGDRARLPKTVGGLKRRAEWDPCDHPQAQALHYRWPHVYRLLADLYEE